MAHRVLALVVALIALGQVYSPSLGADLSDPAADMPANNGWPDEVSVARVYYENTGDLARLVAFDLLEANNLEERYVLAVVDRAGLQRLQALGFDAVVDPAETDSFARLMLPLKAPVSPLAGDSVPDFPCYRTVEETYAAAAALASAHPNLATWIDVGDSWDKATPDGPPGYDLMVLRLTNSAIGGIKPKLLVTASIHAREFAPAELATRFAERLINGYGVDADATWLLDYHEIHLMLQANPDGRKQAEAGLPWRKNTNSGDGCAIEMAYGTDLNRNSSFQWGTGGSSEDACNELYRGSSAGSEPETQAVESYLRTLFPDLREDGASPDDVNGVYLDVHSYGGYVVWPWGYSTEAPPNSAQLQTLGRKLAFFNGYTPGQISVQVYAASGSSVDYAYGELGVPSYAFEIGTSLREGCAALDETVVPANLPALIYAAKAARLPFQTPLGPDAANVTVSPASVPAGWPATLSATIDDAAFGGTGEPVQSITAAEFYVDAPPWESAQPPTPLPLAATDGGFTDSREGVSAVLDTASLAVGRHILFVRGQDAAGNWGPVSATFLDVTPAMDYHPLWLPMVHASTQQ